jgi:hypothetical protein
MAVLVNVAVGVHMDVLVAVDHIAMPMLVAMGMAVSVSMAVTMLVVSGHHRFLLGIATVEREYCTGCIGRPRLAPNVWRALSQDVL